MDFNAHVVDHTDNIFNLLWLYNPIGKMVIDFGIG